MSEPITFNPEQLVRTVAAAMRQDGLVPEGLYDFVAERGDRPMIVVAAAPRTGSTFLSNVLSEACGLSGVPYRRLCAAYGTNEHDLYLPALCMFNRSGCVSQMHMKGTFHNAALMATFGIRPIILVRDLFDIVVSLMGDVRRKEQRPAYDLGYNGYSFIWLEQRLLHLDDAALIDALIDLAVPWYVNFYVSWYRLCQRGLVQAKWVTYEEMMADKAGVIGGLLEFLGVTPVVPIDDDLLGKRFPTFAAGGSGRGRERLDDSQKARIRRLCSYYPDVDFSAYGLAD